MPFPSVSVPWINHFSFLSIGASNKFYNPDFSSSGSMTDFFRAGTSRIGFSFDQSATGSSIDRHRPSFGLGKIVSPERHPVAVVEPFNEDDEDVNNVGFKTFVVRPYLCLAINPPPPLVIFQFLKIMLEVP